MVMKVLTFDWNLNLKKDRCLVYPLKYKSGPNV